MQGTHSGRARVVLAAQPGHPWLANDLANALWLDDALPEALSWARWATRPQANPVHPLAWRTLGNLLLDFGRYGEADAAYRRADPHGADAATQFNRSKTLLGQGDWTSAWGLAEHRLALDPPPLGSLPGPWWQGWPDADEISVWSEQGLGDVLQFLRWLPALLARGPRVTLLVERSQVALLQAGLQWMGPNLTVIERPATDTPLSGCHGSLLSLPWRLALPQPPWPRREGYIALHHPPASAARRRLGLLWGAGRYLDGHTKERDYRRKSLLGEPLMHLLKALEGRSWDLVNLQVGSDREAAEAAGPIWAEALDPQADFLELAQQLFSLELLICVDTAAAHLAGAMGLEAWVLLPWAAESRWQRHSSHTVWYPSMRLWRQPRRGDWSGLWPSLLEELDSRWNSSS